jgi:hypothetical protein
MRRAAPILLAVLVAAPASLRAEDERWTRLDAPRTVQGLRRADVNGDGLLDLLLLAGRDLRVWTGARGRRPSAAPTLRATLGDAVVFADAHAGEGPGLLTLGTDGVAHVPLGAGATAVAVAQGAPLSWRDQAKATFADLVIPGGGLLVPLETGWRVIPPAGAPWAAMDVAVDPVRELTPAGPFLEDSSTMRVAVPRIVLGSAPQGAPADAAPVAWAIAGSRLIATHGASTASFDVSFLPDRGERRLLDVDGDGTPDLVHLHKTNHELTLAVFRVPAPRMHEGRLVAGGDLRPAAAVLTMSGYPQEPGFADLDGDGLLDFVVTTIDIGGANVLKAVTTGKVGANTHAFLQRRTAGVGMFAGEPDASVASDVGVTIRFGYTGHIDIRRSFTILADGDVDGDGRKDLTIRTSREAFTIRGGTAQGVWAKEGRRVSVPPMGETVDVEGYGIDLDGDGREEWVLVYRGATGAPDRVYLGAP